MKLTTGSFGGPRRNPRNSDIFNPRFGGTSHRVGCCQRNSVIPVAGVRVNRVSDF